MVKLTHLLIIGFVLRQVNPFHKQKMSIIFYKLFKKWSLFGGIGILEQIVRILFVMNFLIMLTILIVMNCLINVFRLISLRNVSVFCWSRKNLPFLSFAIEKLMKSRNFKLNILYEPISQNYHTAILMRWSYQCNHCISHK